MAIKEFLAKLVSWNSNQNKGWERSAAEKFQAENQRESALAKEREQQNLENRREEQRQASEVDLTPELSEKPETVGEGR